MDTEEMILSGETVWTADAGFRRVLWDGKNTFNVFTYVSGLSGSGWVNVDCFTNYNADCSSAAAVIASEWMGE